MAVSGLELDLGRYPLVVLRHGPSPGDAHFAAIAAGLGELVRRGPFALINDARGAPMPSAMQRRIIIGFYAAHEREVAANFLACGILGDTALMRGLLTALSWVRPAPHPVRIFATFPEAEAWVMSHFPEPLARRVPPRSAGG